MFRRGSHVYLPPELSFLLFTDGDEVRIWKGICDSIFQENSCFAGRADINIDVLTGVIIVSG